MHQDRCSGNRFVGSSVAPVGHTRASRRFGGGAAAPTTCDCRVADVSFHPKGVAAVAGAADVSVRCFRCTGRCLGTH